MELVKVSETVNRNYDGESATEQVTSISYNVIKNEVVIGNASVSEGYFSISGSMTGSIEEIREMVEAMFVKDLVLNNCSNK